MWRVIITEFFDTECTKEKGASEDEYDFLLDALIILAAETSKAWVDIHAKNLINGGMAYETRKSISLAEV